MQLWLSLAGANGAIAVAAAAVGAHALTGRVSAQQLDWFSQAAQFHLLHALALLGLAALQAAGQAGGLTAAAGWTLQAGILLFCGSLYWLAGMGSGSLGPLHVLTPLGGLALIAGWLLLLAAGLRH